MFADFDALFLPLLFLGIGVGLFSTLVTWAAARRYGRGLARLVPLMAIVAVGFMLWRLEALDGHDMLFAIAAASSVVGPAVVGSFLGMVLAGRPR